MSSDKADATSADHEPKQSIAASSDADDSEPEFDYGEKYKKYSKSLL